MNDLFFTKKDIILDIDIDFFTYFNGNTYPLHKRDIINQITSESFREFISKAKLITIALEPGMNGCGSEENSLEILEAFCQVIPIINFNKIKSHFFTKGMEV